MARTKVSSVAQPEDFRETLEDWGVPLTNSVPSLRRYLPLILAKFVETMCDDLEAHLPENEKSAKIHFITASDAQLSRTAAKGKAVELPAAAPSPAPGPVPAPAKRAHRKREKPTIEANSEAGPSRPAVTPYLAERSSRRQPLASTSKPRSPAKKKEEAAEEDQAEDEELDSKPDGKDEDEDPDEGAGGESSGSGSGAEPDGRDEGAGGGHDNEDNTDSPGDSGSSHAPSGALRSLSLDPAAAPSPFAFSWPTTLPQPLTSTNLLALSNLASDSTLSAISPRKTAFRAPTPIPLPGGDSDDSDADEHPPPGPRRTYPSPPSSSDLSSLSDSPEPDSPEPAVIHFERRRSSRHHSPHDSRLRLSSPTPSASSSASSTYSSSSTSFEALLLLPPKKITPPATHLNRNLADSVSKERRTTFEVLIPLKRYRFESDEGSGDPVKRCKFDGVGVVPPSAGAEGSALTVAAAA